MTTADLKAYLAQVLQETFGTTEFYTDAEIGGYIDEAFIEVILKVPELDYLSLLAKDTGTILANTSNAEKDLTLLTGFFRLSHITIGGAKPRYIKPEQYEAVLSNAFFKPDKNEPVYFIEGKTLKVSLGSDTYTADTTFNIFYYQLPSLATGTEIDDKFIPMIKAFTLYKAYMKNNDFNQADRYYKQYQDDITQLKAIYKGGIKQ